MELWCIFDTETSDLSGNSLLSLEQQPHIIEFAALLGSLDEDGKSEEIGTLDFLCHPGFEITPLTTKLTGITREMLVGVPHFRTRMAEVAGFLARADVRAAHNLTFDEEMLEYEFSREGKSKGHPENWRSAKRQKRTCSVEETEFLFGKRANLSTLYNYCTGKEHTGAHRALADVRATWTSICELRRRKVL